MIGQNERRRGEKLSGPKIGEFSGAIFGDVNAIAIDTRMAQVLFGVQDPSPAQIRVGQRWVRQIAQRLGRTPVQAQAAL